MDIPTGKRPFASPEEFREIIRQSVEAVKDEPDLLWSSLRNLMECQLHSMGYEEAVDLIRRADALYCGPGKIRLFVVQ